VSSTRALLLLSPLQVSLKLLCSLGNDKAALLKPALLALLARVPKELREAGETESKDMNTYLPRRPSAEQKAQQTSSESKSVRRRTFSEASTSLLARTVPPLCCHRKQRATFIPLANARRDPKTRFIKSNQPPWPSWRNPDW